MKAIALTFMLIVLASQGFAQPEGYKSIHQLQSEQYKGVKGDKGPEQPIIPLNRAKSPKTTKVVYGYDPSWTTDTYLHYDLLTHIACFSGDMHGNGSVSSGGFPGTWSATINLAHKNGVKVAFSTTCFNSDTIASVLSSATYRTNAVRNLVTMVRNANCDGVNIDFEGLPVAQKQNMVKFVHELSDSFHTWNPASHVSLATPAVDWSGAWDYDSLAIYADALFIMAYDYFYRGSTTTGPVSPLSYAGGWDVLETIHDYVLYSGNRRSKLLAGFPYYGYDWPCNSSSPGAAVSGSGTAVIFSSAETLAYDRGRQWSVSSYVPWYWYGSYRQCWFDDEVSLGYKYGAVWDSSLAGTGMWALSYDGSRNELWDALRTSFNIPNDTLVNGNMEAVFLDTAAVPSADSVRPVGWLEGQNCLAVTGVDFVHGGSRSLKHCVDAWGKPSPYLSFMFQDVYVLPNTAYTLSGWARKNDAVGNVMRMHLEWYDSLHQVLRDDSTAALTVDNASYQQLTTGSVTSPALAKFARIKLNIWVTASIGYRDRWDDISFGPTGGTGISQAVFTGSTGEAGTVLLSWQTNSEQGLLSWQVERAGEGAGFQAIKTIPAANRPQGCSYQETDRPGVPGAYQYRLSSLDLSGERFYHGSFSINLGPMPKFSLFQNQPNPFRQMTNIRYQIPRSGQVSLKIYNSAGQLVRVLDDGYQMAGEHSVTWDGRNDRSMTAARGVYFCRLEAGGKVMLKKIMLMR
jgi:spore germination protein YaaH